MTRINTNVSSLTAQNRLQRTNGDLQTALTRLSTGLRINSGKDDPAGLIASEALRSDITGLNKAISNTQRASQVIATADSALGQVSSLLNDIRGLVTEAANSGALSDDEIRANQLQIDSSLEAIDRIAQTTTFQGRKLLDGSLDFITKGGTGYSSVTDLQIDQANLGATGRVSVAVDITAAATKASISNTGIAASATAAQAAGSITFGTAGAASEAVLDVELDNAYTIGAEASGNVQLGNSFIPANEATGTLTLNGGAALTVSARNNTVVDGAIGNGVIINITTTTTSGGTTGSYDASSNTLNITLEEGLTGAQIETALDAVGAVNSLFDFSGGNATAVAAGDSEVQTGVLSGGTNTVIAANTNLFRLQAVGGGAADGDKGNDTVLEFTSGASTGAVYDADANKITVTVANGDTISDIAAAINTDLSGDFIAANVTNGNYRFSALDTGTNAVTLTGGTNPTAAARIRLEATDGGDADGAVGNLTDVRFQTGATTGATYDVDLNRLIVTVADGATIDDVANAIDTEGTFQVVPGQTLNGTALFNRETIANGGDIGVNTPTVVTEGTELDGIINITSKESSAAFNKTISFATSNALGAGQVNASLDANGNIVITTATSGPLSLTNITNAINRDIGDDYTAVYDDATQTGDGIWNIGDDDAPVVVNLTGGTQGGGLADDLVFALTGATGTSEFKFDAGASLANIITAINDRKDATGVEAEDDGGNLKITSTTYGSKSVVAIRIISEGANGTFEGGLSGVTRANGTDIIASVNGATASGDGNTLSLNTATLKFSMTVDAGSTTDVNFEITGGGALFQLGGDVVSNQQARLGIGSLSTSRLGGVSGRLSELQGDGAKSLVNDITGASKVIDEVINKVTSLRGRLGAFQRTTLESNMNSLNDTLANLNEAQSTIRDADFAKESANLTRAQVLVQSGTSVLGIANQSAQNVLALLR